MREAILIIRDVLGMHFFVLETHMHLFKYGNLLFICNQIESTLSKSMYAKTCNNILFQGHINVNNIQITLGKAWN